MKKIVFFDLDGTLLEGMNAENSFFLYLLKKKRIKAEQFFAAFKFITCNFIRYKHFVFIKNKAYLKGLEFDEISFLAEEFVTKNLLAKIRVRIHKLVDVHRDSGDKLVLLTGAPEFIARHFAAYLKIDELYATKCVVKNNHFTDRSPLVHPFDQEKLTIAADVCRNYNSPLKESTAYGNSFYDRFLLRKVGHPVAVTPDKLLLMIAKKHKWEILL